MRIVYRLNDIYFYILNLNEMKKIFLLFAAIFSLWNSTNANNVQVSSPSISGQNTSSHYSMVNFDVSWENSWRTSSNESNYDAVWLIVKFRKANSGLWQHATLNYASPGTAAACGHTQPSGSVLSTSSDGKGAFLYRSADGTGNVSYTGAGLRWNYGADGVLDNDSVEIRVYAVEMVYITQGQFYLGTGGTEVGSFKSGSTSNPYLVTSDSAIIIGTTITNLYYSGSGDQIGPLPLAFPKGYKAFWSMKYEISEQQYADFLNSLDATRAATRNIGIPGTANNYVPANPERAAETLSGVDFLAIMDWMALRPMTELEYEKNCRGYNIMPLPNEYAWGNTTISGVTAVNNASTAQETPQNGNAVYYSGANFLARPIRCGAFARDTTISRTESGGSYYGTLDLSGNVQEYTMIVGNTTGRAFTGLHGDGNIDANGEANVTNWATGGLAYRGGYYSDYNTNLRVSDRTYAFSFSNATRAAGYGGRGVRTAE
jgi:formylglycine-generating enzyme required for sulfatase activity